MSVKAVFLDRDGVINQFPGNGKYVTKLNEFHFLPGALEAIKTLTDAGYSIFIVSNQAGVGKGVYTKQKLDHITKNMLRDVKKAGGKIRKVFYCIHHPYEGCDCRKPNIGSIEQGLKMLGKTIRSAKDTFFVGDTKSDIEAGLNAGCKTIFVLSGREDRRYVAQKWCVHPDYIANDLLDALKIIMSDGKPLLKRFFYLPRKPADVRKEI